MPTLVLPPRYTDDSIALWKAAIQAGWAVERLQSWRAPAWLQNRDPILYGEPLFAAAIADELGLALLEPPFDWLSNLPSAYRHREVHFATLKEARQSTKPVFVKPADDKCFAAGVYQSGTQLPAIDVLPDSVPVLIADPVSWEVEFRCFVLEGIVMTTSPYWRNGSLAQAEDGSWPATATEMEELRAFSTTIINDPVVQMPPAFVLDVGKIDGRGWSVVEANSAWGAGIYGCDPAQVLPILERANIRQDKLTPEDRRWVLERQTNG